MTSYQTCASWSPLFGVPCQLPVGHRDAHHHRRGDGIHFSWDNSNVNSKESRMKWSENLKVVEVRGGSVRSMMEYLTVDVVAEGASATLRFQVPTSNAPNFGDVLTITVEGPARE